MSESLYGILVEKSEGEAALRVNSGEPGDGMSAYMRIYLWFAGTTALALTERTQRVMSPNPVKNEAELADAIEKWAEQERVLRAHGPQYELGAGFKISALKILMSCKREQFEFLEREAKSRNGDKVDNALFDDLFSKIREYAHQRRLEDLAKRNRGDPMDIGQLHQLDNQWMQHENMNWDPYFGYDSNCEDLCEPQWHETEHMPNPNHAYLDALGKGKGVAKGKSKGKGKPFNRGPCFMCGESGHIAAECPHGKSKGKGKSSVICWACGEPGHPYWVCPHSRHSFAAKS